MNMTTGLLQALGAGIAGAVLIAVGLYVRRRRLVARAAGDAPLLRELLGGNLGAAPKLRLFLVVGAALSLAAALLDPDVASIRAARGGPVVLLLDASGSMLVEEGGNRRLETQRDLARRLAAELPDVPIGIVAFAGEAYSLTPPTRDRAALEMYLANLDPTIVTQTGSALGAAIRQGLGLLNAAEGPGGSLVLFSDGDETEDEAAAADAASLASRSGVAIHVVGVGTSSGAPVPALDLATGSVEGFLRAPDGSIRISRLESDFLAEVADRGGGTYRVARDGDPIPSLVTHLVESDSPPRPSGTMPPYAWLAGAAFLLLLIEPVAEPLRRRD